MSSMVMSNTQIASRRVGSGLGGWGEISFIYTYVVHVHGAIVRNKGAYTRTYHSFFCLGLDQHLHKI